MPGNGAAALTGREREVLSDMAQGKTDRAIARELVLTSKTVGAHIHHVSFKLHRPGDQR